nr:MAG TPA: hypothetical protein [Caudoviricetes sp.]
MSAFAFVFSVATVVFSVFFFIVITSTFFLVD